MNLLVTCPTCGVDVEGCVESVDADGVRRWTQPLTPDGAGPTGHSLWKGGLVHIERGARCLADTRAAS
ncbi:MAG TPA: hypothetical protein VM345_17915 [Acidimicrobiales bacterium]|jgi:hypothetical protein|nr:hypothetical protein [Acidimicrobiales bacterium]